MKVICVVSLLISFHFFSMGQSPENENLDWNAISKAKRITKIPDFTQYNSVKVKKKAFFDFFKPMVKEQNTILLNEHNRIQALSDKLKSGDQISPKDQKWLKEMATQYRVSPFDLNAEGNRKALLKKVDIIPESLFLAQASLESSWGTSRFARIANNIFGQWCFTAGCGIVPNRRKAGETHEVQKFDTLNDAVTTYMHHLNSHPFYVKLRDSRALSRKEGKAPSGYAMAIGLEKYSARGLEYVKELRSMISFNKLEAIK